MKNVGIFFASSIREFEEDRDKLYRHIGVINDLYKNRLNIKPEMCEDMSNRFTVERKQNEYNEIIRSCDYFYMLVGKRLGKYSAEEFEVAWEHFKKTGKNPIIHAYLSDVGDRDETVTAFLGRLEDIGQHESYYSHIDTIKLNIILELKRDGFIDSEVRFADGSVTAGGEKLMELDNIPIYARHEELSRLKTELTELDTQMDSLRAAIEKDPSNEGLKLARLTVSGQKNKLTKQIHEFEMELLRLCSTVAEMGADGRPLTRREKRARELLEKGDRMGALAVLREIEREKELERAEEKASLAQNEIIGYIRENRLRIDILRTESVGKNAQEIAELYETCVKLAERYSVEWDVLYEYCEFLHRQNSFKRAIEVGERLEKRYEMYPPDDWTRGMLYNLLGMCYDDSNNHKKGEEVYRKSLDIYRRLASENPSAFEPYVAVTCNNFAALYYAVNNMGEAEELYREALDIRRRFASENPAAYEPDVAVTCNNFAALYYAVNNMDEAEKLYREALDIRRRLASENPSAYEPDVAVTCNNLAALYYAVNNMDEAEKLYREALEIYRRLASENPSAYEPDVAMTCNNLAALYYAVNNMDEAEKLYREALDIRRRLASENPSAYEPDVAVTCNNLAILLKNTNHTVEAEKLYREALDIRRRLASENPSAYEPDVAMTCNNLANLLANANHIVEAEKLYREALEIYRRLASENPSAYEPYVAQTCFNLGLFEWQKKNNTSAALEYFREAKTLFSKYPHLAQYAERAQHAIDLIQGQ